MNEHRNGREVQAGRCERPWEVGAIIGAAAGGASAFLVGIIAAVTVLRFGGLLVALFLAIGGSIAGAIVGVVIALMAMGFSRWIPPALFAAFGASTAGVMFGLLLDVPVIAAVAGPGGAASSYLLVLVAPVTLGVAGGAGGWILGLRLRPLNRHDPA